MSERDIWGCVGARLSIQHRSHSIADKLYKVHFNSISLEVTLVQFLEDGIFHVLSSVDVITEENVVTKYKDKFYKCTVVKTSGKLTEQDYRY